MGEAFGRMMDGSTGDERLALVLDPEIDSALLARPGVAQRLCAMLDDAVVRGAVGMVAEIVGYAPAPWGFEPSAVRAEVLLGYGALDEPIAPAHGEWWQRALRTLGWRSYRRSGIWWWSRSGSVHSRTSAGVTGLLAVRIGQFAVRNGKLALRCGG